MSSPLPHAAAPHWDTRGLVFVTGGGGHLGANLVRQLLAEGYAVRALAKPGDNNEGLAGLDIEIVEGDLRDAAGLRRAMAGARRVFHTAALISTLEGNPKLRQAIFETNVLGTRNILRAARDAGVERTVVTSSFGAVGRHDDDSTKPSSEDVPVNPFHRLLPYERSKVHMELEVLRAVAEGQDVVMATSCAILGPHDYIPSRMGRVLCMFANGKLRAYVPGGFEFVAARDIAQGHMLAMRKGRTGQKYIFATRYVTMDEMWEIFESVTGGRRPTLRVPPKLMAGVATVVSSMLNTFAPDYPQKLTPGAIHILSLMRHADTTKARTELGFVPSRIEDAVAQAYEFFCARGAIERPRKVVVSNPAMPAAVDKDAA
jgi:nucleoside-diphosphate-sugar epimerase